MCSIAEQPYRPFVEVSEMLRQFEGKTGGEVLHPFVEPDILNSCCKPYCLC